MVNYGNGKIYKITGSNLTYYGSTTQPLNKRKACHKSLYFNYSSKIIIEKGDWEIVLVEDFKCENKEQLFSRERWWIENNECVNKYMPIKNNDDKIKKNLYCKQWINENKEQKKEVQQKYNEEHKEQIKEKQQKYCEEHKEHLKEINKKYVEEHKEQIREYKKKWARDKKQIIYNKEN